jgi:transcriptional regulator with XRE-family HTH domain
MVDRDRPQSVLGAIIRQQRELAAVPMRQLAEAVGISNPYLSQIERGLRAPSDAVLQALAVSLDLSLEELYKQAGYVKRPTTDDDNASSYLANAIESATELTAAQRRAIAEIYRGFLDANIVRGSAHEGSPD